MTLYIRHSTDLYEVYLNAEGIITQVLRFSGEGQLGKEIAFENLPSFVKTKIEIALSKPNEF